MYLLCFPCCRLLCLSISYTEQFMSTGRSGSSSLRRIQWLGYVLLCFIGGRVGLGVRLVVHDLPPLRAAALRFVAAGALLLARALLQKRPWPRGPSQWNGLLVLSITMMGIPYGLLFWAEQ